uniref:Glutathione S-transferase 3, mitochondrial n=1 Tax=Tetradesmus obliquus TaxID=3088 RepID=A0A383VI21_TETOB|eukprot:jgi/Sobl393_1/17239/SZX65168.1
MQCARLSSRTSSSALLLRPNKLQPAHAPRQAAANVIPRAFAVSPEYGYVAASVAFSAALIQWQAIRVGLARREYGVPYPQMYAEGKDDAAQTFNCTQRAHQNTLETLPALLAMECLLGLQHPLYAATLGMIWNIGRIIYTFGYSTGDPNKRLPGIAVAGLTYVTMIVSTGVIGVKAAGLLQGLQQQLGMF